RDITKLPELRKVFLGSIFDKGHKSFYFRDRWHKGLFPRHYVCLRLTVNTVITECAPLIQYTAEPFTQSGFLDSVAFFSTMHAVSPVTVCSSSV
ncbi:hypothetical protein JQN64_26705, partial [Escherichia coli]|nr:hypothetical protein [Escherichia coli]